jgi:hypothetical protein
VGFGLCRTMAAVMSAGSIGGHGNGKSDRSRQKKVFHLFFLYFY